MSHQKPRQASSNEARKGEVPSFTLKMKLSLEAEGVPISEAGADWDTKSRLNGIYSPTRKTQLVIDKLKHAKNGLEAEGFLADCYFESKIELDSISADDGFFVF